MAVLYRGGTFFDGTQFLDNHALLLEGKLIKAFGRTSDFEGFSGEIIDTSEMTIMPGLIDAHVHLVFSGELESGGAVQKYNLHENLLVTLKNAKKTLKGGVTTVRDCGGRDYIERAVRDAINKGEFNGPTIKIAGKFICMTGGHMSSMGVEADGIEAVVKAVREQIKEKVDHIKVMATGGVITEGVDPEDAHLSRAELTAVVAEANRFKKPTASHAQGTDGIMNAVVAGVTSIEHGIYLNDECIQEMLKRGTFLVPTLCAVEAIQSSDAPDFMKEKCDRIEQVHKKAIKNFYEAGGKIAMGTDMGTPGNMHGDNAREVKSMVGIGMALEDVLSAATQHAAELMRFEDRGQLKAGMNADILIAKGDVRKNVEVISDHRNHVSVIKDGRIMTDNFQADMTYQEAA